MVNTDGGHEVKLSIAERDAAQILLHAGFDSLRSVKHACRGIAARDPAKVVAQQGRQLAFATPQVEIAHALGANPTIAKVCPDEIAFALGKESRCLSAKTITHRVFE
jgi:hypothetical protein